MNIRFKAAFVIAVVFFLGALSLTAAEEPPGKSTASEGAPKADLPGKQTAAPEAQDTDAAYSGLLDSLWSRVRTIMISDEEAISEDGVRYSSTAGIRGSKSKADILKPIWKGKRKDKKLPADARLYNEAKADFEKEDYKSAVAKMTEFQKVYKYSQIRPQAFLLLAISQAKDNNTQEAIKTLEEFLKEFPDHELSADAKKLKNKMAKSDPE